MDSSINSKFLGWPLAVAGAENSNRPMWSLKRSSTWPRPPLQLPEFDLEDNLSAFSEESSSYERFLLSEPDGSEEDDDSLGAPPKFIPKHEIYHPGIHRYQEDEYLGRGSIGSFNARHDYLCDDTCPLKGGYEPAPDPPLPSGRESASLSSAEACKLLYKPIQEWQTRILILEPGTFDSGLVAKLVTTYIVHFSGVIVPDSQQRIEYVALSYTWGLADFRRYIRINGVEFPITDNLYAFLQRYRCRYARRHLWIDALCINQMDPSEKAAQIGNMLYIFGKASEVVVWLGDHGPHSKVAIMYLKWLEGFFLKKTHVARWNWEEKMGPYHARKCFMLSIRALAGLKDICSRQWPTRIWIRQEVWAARSVSVMCGSTYFTWRQYLMAALTTLHEEHSTQVYTIGISPRQAQLLESLQILRDTADDIEDRHQVQQAPGPDRNRKYDMETLINLLNNSTLCQSTIPHDRIFSLLGMAPMLKQRVGSTRRLTSSLTALFGTPLSLIRSRRTIDLQVDYSITVEALFASITKKIIKAIGPEFIMSSNFTGTLGSSGGLHLPSWALDLRYPFHGVRQVAPPTILHQFRFLNPDDNHRTLIAVGFRVGILSDELVTLPPAETEDNLSVPGSLTVKCDFEADDVTTDTLARCDFDKRLYDIVRKIPPSMHDQEIGQLLELFSRPENIIVPPEYQAGDYLVAIDWVDEPQVLRPVSSATQRPEFEYIGPARRIPQREDLHLLDLFIRHGWAEHALPLGGPERYDSWHLELETFVLV